jgi:hypothetical protein
MKLSNGMQKYNMANNSDKKQAKYQEMLDFLLRNTLR